MRAILKEPLFHFLLLGAALFALYGWVNRAPQPEPDQIIVSARQIEMLSGKFSQFHQRSPSADELKGLVDEYVREEVLSREAVKLGLDQDDSVIRRRLQQKMEFIAADLAAADEPTEAELVQWLADHADRYRHDPRFSFRQVQLNPGKRGDRLEADVAALLAQLSRAGAQANVSAVGDGVMLPDEFADQSQSAVAAQFGQEFAARMADLKIGQWIGPIPSGYGVHLVVLTARSEGRQPVLDEVRDAARRDLMSHRHLQANRRFLDGLLSGYRVTIEWPQEKYVSSNQPVPGIP